MRYSSLILYTIGIIIISGCHHEPQFPDKPVPSSVSSASDDDTKKWALVIGIDNYSNQKKESGLKDLWYAVNDSSAIKTRLESMGFDVELLQDEDATKKKILDVFKKYESEMVCNGQFILFYSGHGITDYSGQEGYIVSSDGERISFEELRYNTFFLPPKHILYILDSCRSGILDPAVKRTAWVFNKPAPCVNPKEQEPASKAAVFTLTAASSNEDAIVNKLKWYGHSYFTYHLLEGLDGFADINNDCEINTMELGGYLTQRDPSQVAANNKIQQSQHPLFNRVYGEGEMVFIPNHCQQELQVPRQQQLVPETQKWKKSDAYKGRTNDPYKEPTQLLVDSKNNLYVLDAPARRVYKFDSEGKYILSYSHENWDPTSMALNNDSSLWVYYSSDERGEVIIYEGGKKPRRWGGEKPDLLAECVSVDDDTIPPKKGLLAIDTEKNIILADQETGILTKCTVEGLRLAEFPTSEEETYVKTVNQPKGLAVDKFGYIYIADTGGHGIQRYSFDVKLFRGYWRNAQGDSRYFFNSPHGVAVDANAYVYIADTDNNRIKKYTSDGKTLLECWGKQCWGNQEGQYIEFNRPQGVAVSLDGRSMYVADTDNKRVRKFFFLQK